MPAFLRGGRLADVGTGAYFSMHPFQFQSYLKEGWELNIYATPALITLVLLVVETGFLAFALPETRPRLTVKADQTQAEKDPKPPRKSNATESHPVLSRLQRLSTLKKARALHFNFLLAFSGEHGCAHPRTSTDLLRCRVYADVLDIRLCVEFVQPPTERSHSASIRLEQLKEWTTSGHRGYHVCSFARRLHSDCDTQNWRKRHGSERGY